MNEHLRAIAENIMTHLEAGGVPRVAHAQRLANLEVMADILLQSLTHYGYVRITSMSGQALRPDAFVPNYRKPDVQNPDGIADAQ